MSIDELLKLHEYDIYNNRNIDPNILCELAEIFSEESIDILKYFSYTKFSSKFCWTNFIFIIKEMKYPQKLKGLPCLFELLQDINWPIFQEVAAALMSFDKKRHYSFYGKVLISSIFGRRRNVDFRDIYDCTNYEYSTFRFSNWENL